MEKWELGERKKSFSIYYGGGEIWCEHLDSLYHKRDILKKKLKMDILKLKQPSATSHIIVVLNETEIDEELLDFIWSTLAGMGKDIRKLGFVGLNKKMKKRIARNAEKINWPVNCLDDLEKAKEWIMG